jgi:hypothetical protein
MLPIASVQYVVQQISNRNGISATPIFSVINVKKDGISMGKSKVLLSIESLRGITNYAHWIPITQGLHLSYFDKHFPGWEWNDFVPRLIEEKILFFNGDPDNSISLSQGLFILKNVDSIEFIPSREAVKIIVNKNNGE